MATAKRYESIQHRKIIDNLDQYLAWNNIHIRLNHGGICRGLAIICAKYVFEGKESEEFYDLLDVVSNMDDMGRYKNITAAMMHKIDEFIIEILLAFDPRIFDPQFKKVASMRTLKIT